MVEKGISVIMLFHYTTNYDRKHIMSVQIFLKSQKNKTHNHHPFHKRIYKKRKEEKNR
jgi:hypothetical protein